MILHFCCIITDSFLRFRFAVLICSLIALLSALPTIAKDGQIRSRMV